MRYGVKALIEKNGKILILHKALDTPRFPDHWDLPGGGLEKLEKFDEGVKREVFEETSLIIEPIKIIWTHQMIVNGNLTEYEVFNTKFVSGEVKLSHEHIEFKWVDKKEALNYKLQPYLEKYFKEIN